MLILRFTRICCILLTRMVIATGFEPSTPRFEFRVRYNAYIGEKLPLCKRIPSLDRRFALLTAQMVSSKRT